MTIHVVSQHAIAELAAGTPSHDDAGLRIEIELKDGKAPTSFRLLRAGLNTSTKGDFLFTEASQSACMAYQAKRGMPTVIDYEHASRYATMAPDPQKAGRAAGRCKLECKQGELWASNVKWTKAAVDAIESGEQDLFSPVFSYNRDTMVIGELTGIALTATPALDNLESLAAKDGAAPEHDMNEELKRFLAELSTQMGLKDGSTSSVTLAFAQLRADNEKLLTACDAKSASEALGKLESWKSSTARVAELTTKLATLETSNRKAEVTTLIEAALTARKVSPVERPFLEKMGESDLAQLKGWLAVKPDGSVGGAAITAPAGDATPAGGPTGVASLTDEQKHVAKILGHDRDPKKMAAYAEMTAKGIKVNQSLTAPKN